MPQADAMVLVARNYERYKNNCREKEREEIARQAAKMANEAILQERDRGGPEEGGRGGHPPAIQSLINLLADNRYLTAEETDRVIDYLRGRKERLLRSSAADALPGELRGRAEVKFSSHAAFLSSRAPGGGGHAQGSLRWGREMSHPLASHTGRARW